MPDLPSSPSAGRTQSLTVREYALVDALQAIVMETMDYPPFTPSSGDSYLPPDLLAKAQGALAGYGLQVEPVLPHPESADDAALDQAIGKLVSGFGELA